MRKNNLYSQSAVDQPAENWYLVKIVFQIICGSGNHKPQFEEQLRLIIAASPVAATDKAKQLILAKEFLLKSSMEICGHYRYLSFHEPDGWR